MKEAELSKRTRHAVQDYTALNTIITAMERKQAGEADAFDVAILEAFTAGDYRHERVRLRVNCPLGRRLAAALRS